MTPLFPARRAAEELDAALAGRASAEVLDRHAELLATVALLQTVPEVTPRAEFVEDLRSRLMLAAQTELVPTAPVVRRAPATPSTRSGRRVGTVAAALVIVGGTAGMAAAASGSLPGQPLYPIKRGGEQVSEIVRLTDSGRGLALLGQAENRLGEVRDLITRGQDDPTLVTGTLDSFRSAADQGAQKLFVAYQRDGDESDVVAVRRFTASQMAVVEQLSATSDPQRAALLLDAADTLADIDQQARQLCPACGGDAPVLTPAALSEGAAAASVDTLLARPVQQAQADIAAARVAALLAKAQDQADVTPKIDLTAPDAGAVTGAGGVAQAGEPVTSTITGSGDLVPGVKSGTKAVEGLVSGVTSTVTGVTGGVAGLGEQLGDTVGKTTKDTTGTLGSTLDDTLGTDVGGTLDGVTQGLLP